MNLLFVNLNVTLLLDIHTVKELSNILVLDHAYSTAHGSSSSDLLHVVSSNEKAVLYLWVSGDGDTFGHFDRANTSFTQEISDFKSLVIREHTLDGEMRVHSANLVLESLGNTGDHVIDVTGDGSQRGELFLVSEPTIHSDSLTVVHRSEFKRSVFEVSCKLTTRSLYSDNS